MTYHPLTSEDGLTSDEERREHVADLVEKIMPYFDQLSDKEQGFVEQMSDGNSSPSVKQHLWLKDIWSRFA